MTASESSTLAAENEKYDSRGDEHSTHIVEQRTISRQIYLLQSVTVPSHHSLTISNIWTHIPAPLLQSSANLDSCFAHLPSTCSAKLQNIQTELLTTRARKNCVGMTRPQAFWDYFLLSLWLGITKNDNSYETSRGWIFSNTNSRTYGRLILRYSQFC